MTPEIKSSEDFLRRISVGFIVSIWISAPYLLLQQFSMYSVWWLQEPWLDRWIEVDYSAIYAYMSYYVLLVWAALWVSHSGFVHYMRSICIVALISHFCFLLFPTGIERLAIDNQHAPYLYHWLTSWEKPRNCLPSLHAGLAMLATLSLWEKSRVMGVLSATWTLLILWSALALKQHYSLDLACGMLLGVLVWKKWPFPIKQNKN